MLTLAVIVLTIGCAIASPIEPKIIGGMTAAPGQFPYQVSLRQPDNNWYLCGASIISDEWILTAAHCIQGVTPSDVVVVVGTNSLNSGGLGYGVSVVLSHNAYNKTNNENDIALIKVTANIAFSATVKAITLATGAPPGGVSLTLSGWGLTSYEPNVTPDDLQFINLQALTVAQCQQQLPGRPVFQTHQCTTEPKGQGACKGDSGGPLVYGSQQVGVVSWGTPCALGLPDVFTSVASYRSWINTITGV